MSTRTATSERCVKRLRGSEFQGALELVDDMLPRARGLAGAISCGSRYSFSSSGRRGRLAGCGGWQREAVAWTKGPSSVRQPNHYADLNVD